MKTISMCNQLGSSSYMETCQCIFSILSLVLHTKMIAANSIVNTQIPYDSRAIFSVLFCFVFFVPFYRTHKILKPRPFSGAWQFCAAAIVAAVAVSLLLFRCSRKKKH